MSSFVRKFRVQTDSSQGEDRKFDEIEDEDIYKNWE